MLSTSLITKYSTHKNRFGKRHMNKIVKFLAVLSLVAAAGLTSVLSTPAQADTAKIDMRIGKVGFIVGVSGGRGTVVFNDQSYPIRVGGVSLGATFAISSIDLTGTVFNINSIEDLYGVYTAGSAGLAVIAGGKVGTLSNARGVSIEVQGRTIGVEFSIDLSGINIQPR
jgi:hypothetical protein